MPSTLQKTITAPITVEGIGIHSGCPVTVTLRPALKNTGIVFKRTDLPEKPIIKATYQNVSETAFSTHLQGSSNARIQTTEHLMAALYSSGVTQLYIDVDGPEMPILDGSALEWVKVLESKGITNLDATINIYTAPKKYRIANQHRWLEITPDSKLTIDMTMPLDDGSIHRFVFHENDHFKAAIAPARTFSFKKHIDAMRAQNFIKGGSLKNALVIDHGQPVNEGGLRLPNECARHKVLDFLGDWFLAGCLIKGAVQGFASGHTLNNKLLCAVMSDLFPASTENTTIHPDKNQA